MFRKLLINFCLAVSAYSASAAYIPVSVTGYNADVVANGTGPASGSITLDVDGAGYAFMAADFNPSGTPPTRFLPTGGLVTSANTPGLTFQMAAYTTNNSLRILATNTDSLVFATPRTAGEIFVMATSGSGATTVNMTVNFTDGTNQVFTAISVNDWYNGTPYAINGLGRVNVGSNGIDNDASNPRLYEFKLALNSTNFAKLVRSIKFDKTLTAGVLNVMGISVNTVCTGAATAGAAVSSAPAVCPSTSFVLSLPGSSAGVGTTFQWQSSTTGGAPWTNIAGATSASYTNPGQTVATTYRAYVSCNSGTADTSTNVTVTMQPANQCYCNSIAVYPGDEDIVNVTFGTLNNTSTCTSVGPGPGSVLNKYSNYTTLPATNVVIGSTVAFSVQIAECANNNYDNMIAIWIDYNQDGVFANPGERVYISPASTYGPQTATGNITIPPGATAGNTRMRVLSVETASASALDPCASYNWGETEDYLLNLTGGTVPTCVTTPTAPANAASVCAGTTTLSWPAVTGATGYDVYLNTGATATTVVSTNQAGTTYAATVAAGPYAWKVVPKNATGPATGCATFTFTVNATVAPSVSIAANPTGTICTGTPVTFTATPTNGGTTPSYQWKKGTTNVGTNSATYTDNALTSTDVISVVMTSNATCPSPATATSNTITTTVVPRPTATITPSGTTTICSGGSLSIAANTGTGFTYQWQQNNANIAATSATYSATATGNYRVIVSNGACADTSANDTLNVIPKPAATVTPSGSAAVCAGSSVLLSGPAPATGITYQWQLNGTDITGATSDTYSATTAGNYRLVLSNGTCTDTSTVTAITVNPLPTATVTAAGPTTFCTGGSVTLSANTGTGITYKWLRNNFVIAGATAANYAANTTGNYAVIVTNTATGCFDTSRPAITVTVSTIPSATLTVTGTLTFCQGSNVRFQAATGTGFTYVWYKDAAVIPGATTAIYTATTAGVYYCVITNGPCVTTTATRTVVVNPLPVATATAAGATSFCTGGSVIINANTGTGLTYQWRLNAANIAGATSPSYTATASGVYTVVVSNGTCTNTSNTILVNVSTMPAPVITTVGTPVFCQGNSITLNANTATGYTYQWALNGNPITGATASAYSATATGNYTVTITNGTCVATSVPFVVSVTPAPPANITPAGPTTFCQGGSVLLNANRAAGYSYQWTLNSANIAGATSWQYNAVATGNYSVNIFDGTCPATAGAVGVVVNDFPIAVVTVTGGVNLSTTTFASYQWYRNGILIPGATAQNYTAVRDGYYAVLVTDGAGCSATSPVQLITALDIDNLGTARGEVKIWPNPASTIVHVDAAQAVNISIGSIDGKELMKADNANTIDIGHLPQGLYLIRITDNKSGALIRVDKINKQ